MDKRETGEKIATFKAGPFEITVKDDGFDDYDTSYEIHFDGETFRNMNAACRSIRRDCEDDAEFATRLKGVTPATFPEADKPFKCQGCGLTWPGKDNEGNDMCPKCHGN